MSDITKKYIANAVLMSSYDDCTVINAATIIFNANQGHLLP